MGISILKSPFYRNFQQQIYKKGFYINNIFNENFSILIGRFPNYRIYTFFLLRLQTDLKIYSSVLFINCSKRVCFCILF